jgi:hypothetical protein
MLLLGQGRTCRIVHTACRPRQTTWLSTQPSAIDDKPPQPPRFSLCIFHDSSSELPKTQRQLAYPWGPLGVASASSCCTPCLPFTRLSPVTTGETHGLRRSQCGRVGTLSGLPHAQRAKVSSRGALRCASPGGPRGAETRGRRKTSRAPKSGPRPGPPMFAQRKTGTTFGHGRHRNDQFGAELGRLYFRTPRGFRTPRHRRK